MTDFVKQICALSVFCGIALSLTPEGSVKKATALCCTLLLMMTALTAFRSFDYSTYALEIARYRELGHALADDSEERTERIKRLVVEQEYAEYIRQQAAAIGINDLKVAVSVRWDTAGVWVPESVRLSGSCTDDQRAGLQTLISADLGIEKTHQEWIRDEA